MTNNTDIPVFNIPRLRYDLYLLAAMLTADAHLADKEHISVLSAEHFYGEAVRLLILTATFVRQILDIGDESGVAEMPVGKYYNDFPHNKQGKNLSFRMACNRIIHAKGIWLHDTRDLSTDKFQGVAVHTGTIIIDSDVREHRRALLDGDAYIRSCIMLCNDRPVEVDRADS